MGDGLDAARDAFSRRSWTAAFDGFTSVGPDALDAGDCERLAVAGYLTGQDAASTTAWEVAYRRHVDAGDVAEAVRCAFWIGFGLLMTGQMAQAGGWFGRGGRMVDDGAGACAGAGYLMIPQLLGALEGGDAETARDLAVRAGELGRRFDDLDLVAFATLGQGQSLLALGDVATGIARFDEVMVAVTTGEVGPIASGIVYCAVILECMQRFDVRRASEWTEALGAWCDGQPDLVPYRGQCLVHRSQVEQAAGHWDEAAQAADAACRRLEDPPHPALGLAHYQVAELLRLRGEFGAAEAAYGRAARCGYSPVPGLALLELARGRTDGAAATIRRALAETSMRVARPPLLAAAVAIFRATGDRDDARTAADELAQLAAELDSPVLRAASDHALGAVALDGGDPTAALRHLRAAADSWRELGMPYDAARTAVLIGHACEALGDRSSGAIELAGARETFTGLGARPDLRLLVALDDTEPGVATLGTAASVLSPREREVLVHVAAGRTNRQIATELVISQHTVSRHLENIFAKLGVTTRAAATAYAYEHDLL